MSKINRPFSSLWSFIVFLFAWMLAAAIFIVGASIINTQFVLARLSALDVPIDFDMRLATTEADIINVLPFLTPDLPAFAIAFSVSLLVAMLVAIFIARRLSLSFHVICAAAGATAIAGGLELLWQIFNISLIAGTRDLAGYLSFCGMGAFAGLIFATFNRRFTKS